MSVQEAQYIPYIKKQVFVLCPTQKTFTEVIPIALLAFFANPEYTSDNCIVHKSEVVQVLAELLIMLQMN